MRRAFGATSPLMGYIIKRQAERRNITREKLRTNNIADSTSYINDESISKMGHILRSGPQIIIQTHEHVLSEYVFEISDHRPLWAQHVISVGSDAQGYQGVKAKRLPLLRTELTLRHKAET